MNKTRLRKHEKPLREKLRYKKATDYVRKWIYSNTAFERLQPEE